MNSRVIFEIVDVVEDLVDVEGIVYGNVNGVVGVNIVEVESRFYIFVDELGLDLLFGV